MEELGEGPPEEGMPTGRQAEGAWPEPLMGRVGGRAGRRPGHVQCDTQQKQGEAASSSEDELLSFWKDFHLI